MRRKLSKTLVRSARQAAFLTTLGLLFALSVAVGGFVASPHPQEVLAAVLPTVVTGRDTTGPSVALALSGAREPSHEASHAVVPLSEQPFETSRAVETPLTTSTSEDVVRANRLVTGSGTPTLRPGDRIKVSVSFYYCEMGGASPARGDGGGFCGAMRDGSVVYNGAAACDVVYLGQHFRIEGDPLGRVYRCADTGSAVHGLHRDIWFGSSDDGWKWQRSVGQAATIEILP